MQKFYEHAYDPEVPEEHYESFYLAGRWSNSEVSRWIQCLSEFRHKGPTKHCFGFEHKFAEAQYIN